MNEAPVKVFIGQRLVTAQLAEAPQLVVKSLPTAHNNSGFGIASVYCFWFDKQHQYQEAELPLAALRTLEGQLLEAPEL